VSNGKIEIIHKDNGGGWYDNVRALGRGDDGVLWAAHANPYVIEKLDPKGNVVRVYVRKAEWFRLQAEPNVRPVEPETKVLSIASDSGGLLWVLIEVPAPDWKKYQMYDERQTRVRIEVIDIVRKQLLTFTIVQPGRSAKLFGGHGLYARHYPAPSKGGGIDEQLIDVFDMSLER
jgi:hypothetical protein